MKKSMGRRKVEMKKIEKDGALRVCFTKRRQGLFKKASELSLLCGAHVALIVFSPGGKPFVFAHPSLDSVVNTITSTSSSMNPPPPSSLLTHQQRRIDDLNREHVELLARMEAEQARSREIKLTLSELEMRRSEAEGMMPRRTEEIYVSPSAFAAPPLPPLQYASVGEPVWSDPLPAMWETPVEELEMLKSDVVGVKDVMSRPSTPLLEYANVGMDRQVEERLFWPYFVGGGSGDNCGGGGGGGDDCGEGACFDPHGFIGWEEGVPHEFFGWEDGWF
ncbi:Agamous-like MADS-box protein AGL62 [Acorus gramineus]|uniref:Agamous-like MADS-box protein AGL62 n=1 Tax=Acorus gramineus TaxID=55184 RepID=A0AAV9BC73_ACOGR|nr:Agamous-like MADS-box protein AGL62 [Acorus gramineus]